MADHTRAARQTTHHLSRNDMRRAPHDGCHHNAAIQSGSLFLTLPTRALPSMPSLPRLGTVAANRRGGRSGSPGQPLPLTEQIGGTRQVCSRPSSPARSAAVRLSASKSHTPAARVHLADTITHSTIISDNGGEQQTIRTLTRCSSTPPFSVDIAR